MAFTPGALLLFLTPHLRAIPQITAEVFTLANGRHPELLPIQPSQAIPDLDTVVAFLITVLLLSPTVQSQATLQSMPHMVPGSTAMRPSTLPTQLLQIAPEGWITMARLI